jgi:hypothetical protein
MIQTNLDLKKACSRLLGADDPSQLGEEADDIQGYVNQAYRMCYNPADGLFPRYARRPLGVHFVEPINVTFQAKKGSTAMGGLVATQLDKANVGARVKVGEGVFYTYAGFDSNSTNPNVVTVTETEALISGAFRLRADYIFDPATGYWKSRTFPTLYHFQPNGIGGWILWANDSEESYYVSTPNNSPEAQNYSDPAEVTQWYPGSMDPTGPLPVVKYKRLPQHTLVEPWAGENGTVSAVIHTCVAPLPVRAVHVFGNPELVGRGKLYPLAGAEGEIDARASWPGPDFYTLSGGSSGVFRRPITWTSWEVGEPYFYHVNELSMPYGLAVYPLPDKAYSVNLRVGILPDPLIADGDIPVLPGDSVQDILAPIARYLTATQSKRFSGANIQGLKEAYDTALSRLKALSAPQIETGGVIRPACSF